MGNLNDIRYKTLKIDTESDKILHNIVSISYANSPCASDFEYDKWYESGCSKAMKIIKDTSQ